MDEKIQKVLARAGYGSRREIERWIEQGRIKINGSLATLGDRITANDHVLLDGKPLRKLQHLPRLRVIAYHKPEGEVCTRHDPEGRTTIYEHLPHLQNGRWISVGRLDLNTSGLLLLTTDGELANRLMHPSREIEREYAVRVLGEVSNNTLQQLQNGVELDDGPAHFERILDAGGQGRNHWYHVTLKEGRNREVRRMWEAFDLTVSRLLRIRFAFIELQRSLRPGKWRDLTDKEVSRLLELAGMARQTSPNEQKARGSKKKHKKKHYTRRAKK